MLHGDPPECCVYEDSCAQPDPHTLQGPQCCVPTFEWIPRVHGIGLLVHCDLPVLLHAAALMASPTGFEPVAYSLEGCCSIHLS